jgi:hypothetical protein
VPSQKLLEVAATFLVAILAVSYSVKIFQVPKEIELIESKPWPCPFNTGNNAM